MLTRVRIPLSPYRYDLKTIKICFSCNFLYSCTYRVGTKYGITNWKTIHFTTLVMILEIRSCSLLSYLFIQQLFFLFLCSFLVFYRMIPVVIPAVKNKNLSTGEKKILSFGVFEISNQGERGIRTLGTKVFHTTDQQSDALNLSAISPEEKVDD